jgi:hypothetical protein
MSSTNGDETPAIPLLAKVGALADRFCHACMLLFLAATTLLTLVVTATMPHYTYQIELSFVAAPLVAVGTLAFVALLRSQRFLAWLDSLDEHRLMSVLAIYFAVAGICWVTLANVWPAWDAGDVDAVANEILAGARVAPDSYASRFPYQIPLAALVSALKWVFGDASYQAFELLNVASVVATAYGVRSLARNVFEDERTTKLSILLMFLFLPLVLYCTFQYGNLVALPFCVKALSLQVDYFKHGTMICGVRAVVLACVGTLIKSSMVVVLAGMVVAWLVNALKQARAASLALVVISLAAHLAFGAASGAFARIALGVDQSNSTPRVAWIAMGLQGGVGPGNYNPGWFNSDWLWSSSYMNDAYDPQRIGEDSRKSIRQSLETFVHDPAFAATFFVVKYIAEWCQPDFEALLTSNWTYTDSDEPPMAERTMSAPLYSIYYGKANTAMTALLDCYQFALALGALAAICMQGLRDIERLAPLLVCAGTALLYLFWEAQSQYIMHAYVLMVPYAAFGLQRLSRVPQTTRLHA